jgi:hypothetical protein
MKSLLHQLYTLEKMKYYTFYRESNNFDDILNDVNLKKNVDETVRWDNHLLIGINEYIKDIDKIYSYVTLKYGDDMRNNLTKDYSPIPNVDYIPIRK